MIRRLVSSVFETALQSPPEAAIYPHPFSKTETAHFGWLTNVSPCFPISSNNIKIITEPTQFYNTVLQYCKEASHRIMLVSLYLGTGDLEKRVVNALMANEQFQKQNLIINVLLDYTRGSRNSENSRTVLQPLLQQNNKNCTVSFYHTPVLRGILKKYMPDRYNELIGLQHMKLYIFDDTLIISGANLSNDYFTNRQDRYFVIKDKKLTDFYHGLVNKVQSFSLKMDQHNRVTFAGDWKCSPYKGSKELFVEKACNAVEQHLNHYIAEQNMHFVQSCDTFIFPTFQMGQLGVEQDSFITDKIFAEAPQYSKLKIATGYFNLTTQYMATLIQECNADCEILIAHPKANGFLGSKGLSGGIPFAYSLIAEKFRQMCANNGQHYRIKLIEYLREGWTYHGKGLWYYAPNNDYPCMTMIGSPNFGDRSVTKDLETQLVIVTENQQLRKQLHDECQRLYDWGLPADTKRKVPLWVNMLVSLFKGYF
ncbi:CDP-diacylglycerol--glycerol-3-phosphate 3-phosphatidyltransferase, mitochondrial [Euwallacea similis]|uniref:CDP-diacylglycerol--glycerol-3-phosphate 3-phosphatidyltransferase, mitochondrial n=1 Tax=Euwallacea similis TaxID=1736056 RepID=UPI00344E5DCB